MLGDRWSLLILRDLMLRNARSFKDLLACQERIASNILADRLKKLERHGLITTHPDPDDRRKLAYVLTAKGVDLAPAIAEIVLWVGRNEPTGNAALIQQLRERKEEVIQDVRQGWARNISRLSMQLNNPGSRG